MAKRNQGVKRQKFGFKCAWCQKAIPDDAELFSIGARARPGVELTTHEGKYLDISLEKEGRVVRAIVAADDSPAKAEGYDLLFVTCGERCADELTEKVEGERR
jgi:hypothetical protein